MTQREKKEKDYGNYTDVAFLRMQLTNHRLPASSGKQVPEKCNAVFP
jgi:hypothetical protein